MRRVPLRAILASCVLASVLLMAQDPTASVPRANSSPNPKLAVRTKPRPTVSADDGLSILAAALDSRAARLHSSNDCSHLAHAIYERAGFPYAYASSSDLYEGVNKFERVRQPQPGDLIAWRGHVGIVVKPARHTFFSFLRSGPGTDDWASPYWKTRGRPRFYRYLQNPARHRAELLSTTGSGLPE